MATLVAPFEWNYVFMAVIAVAQAVGAYFVWDTKKDIAATKATVVLAHEAIIDTQKNVQIIEKATNSLQAIALAKTGEAAFAAGKDEGRAVEEAKAATLAQGTLAAKGG